MVRPDVFISYAREDIVFVRSLDDALRRAGKDVWVDWEDIPPSADWRAKVHEGIESALAMVVVVSPDVPRSEVCAEEIEHAIALNKRVVPVLRRETDGELPEALRRPNWIFLRDGDDFAAGVTQLVEALDTDLEWRDMHARLAVRALEWRRADEDASMLLRGDDLRAAEDWAARGSEHREGVTRDQADFILASRRGTSRRQRLTLSAVSVALVVAIVLAVFALVQRHTAIERERVARSRQLAAEGLARLDRDPAGALARAAHAVRIQATTQAVDALRAALMHPRPSAVVRGTASPDGRRALVLGRDGTAAIVDVARGRRVGRLTGHVDALAEAAFSPDGRHVVTAVRAGKTWQLRLWPGPGGRDAVLRRDGSLAAQVAFDPASFSADGRRFAVGADDGTAAVWDTASGRRLRSMDSEGVAVLDGTGRRVLVGGGEDGSASVLDVDSGAVLAARRLTPEALYRASFSPDGTRLLAFDLPGDGAAGQYAYVWSWAGGGAVTRLGPHGQLWVNDARFSPDGRQVVTAGEDRAARIWDLRTARPTPRTLIIGHDRSVESAAFSPDGSLLVTGSDDATARLWDPRTGRELARLTGHTGAVEAGFTADNRVITQSEGQARVWPADVRRLAIGEDITVFDARFSPDGRQIVTAGGDQRAVLWDAATGKRVRAMSVGPLSSYSGDEGTAAGFSADGVKLLLSTADGPARIVDLHARTSQIRRYGSSPDESGAWVFPPVFDPSGRFVLTAGFEGPAQLRDAGTGRVLAGARGATAVVGAAFSGDGRHLATFQQGKPVAIWHVPDLRREASLPVARGQGYDAALSPDGRLAVTFGVGAPRLWDVGAQRALHALPAHTGSVGSAAFSPDGRFVATAGEDGLVRVSETASGRLVAVLAGQGDDVTTASFSPDGRRLVIAGRDGSALVRPCPACRSENELAALARTVR